MTAASLSTATCFRLLLISALSGAILPRKISRIFGRVKNPSVRMAVSPSFIRRLDTPRNGHYQRTRFACLFQRVQRTMNSRIRARPHLKDNPSRSYKDEQTEAQQNSPQNLHVNLQQHYNISAKRLRSEQCL